MRNPGSDHSIDVTAVRRFLTEASPDEERERILQAAFEDAEFAEWIEAVEMELADEYVLGLLSPSEREGFEKRIERNPATQDAVAMSSLLTKRFRKRRIGPTSLLAAAAAILTVVLLPSVWRQSAPPTQTAVDTERIVTSPPVVTWNLVPGRQRDPGRPSNVFGRPSTDARISFRLGERGNGELKARIETPEGIVVWRGAAQTADGTLYITEVPAVLLPEPDYILFVDGHPAFPFSIR